MSATWADDALVLETFSARKHEILKFLDVPTNVFTNSTDKLNYLETLMSAFYLKVPTQNFDLLATPTSDRHLPTLEDTLESILSGRGGMCWKGNVFFGYLLKVLGFEVDLVPSGQKDKDTFGCHVFPLVRNASGSGSIHIADVAAGFPAFPVIQILEPDPKTGEWSSELIEHSLVQCRIERNGEWIARKHYWTAPFKKSTEYKVYKNPPIEWFTFYDFCLDTNQDFLKTCTYAMEKYIFCPPLESGKRRTEAVRAVRKLTNGRLVAFRDKFMYLETDDQKWETKEAETENQLIEWIGNFFPESNEKSIGTAVEETFKSNPEQA